MKIGSISENKNIEKRIAITPEVAKTKLLDLKLKAILNLAIIPNDLIRFLKFFNTFVDLIKGYSFRTSHPSKRSINPTNNIKFVNIGRPSP